MLVEERHVHLSLINDFKIPLVRYFIHVHVHIHARFHFHVHVYVYLHVVQTLGTVGAVTRSVTVRMEEKINVTVVVVTATCRRKWTHCCCCNHSGVGGIENVFWD